MATRIRDIIQVALARRGITRYRLTGLLSEGWQLPGRAYDGETETESGIVVTPDRAYRFWVGWADGDYTLGEEDGSWRELTPEHNTEEDWQEIWQLQQQMRGDPTFGMREPIFPPVREPGKPTEREALIIWHWLAPHFFNEYDLIDYEGPTFETFDVRSGGHDLVGSLLPGEVQDITGIVVVNQGIYHFQLSWIWGPADDPHHNPGHYSLGDKDGSWYSVSQEAYSEEQWQRFRMAQQRLEQAFAQLPRAERPHWRDLAEDDTRPVQPRPRRKQLGERRPRQPRVLRGERSHEDTQSDKAE